MGIAPDRHIARHGQLLYHEGMTFDLATTAVLMTAAGRGTRAGGGQPKQWRLLAGRPVLDHTLSRFSGFGRVVLTVHPDDMAHAISLYAGRLTIVAGGETRAASVRAGLEVLDNSQIRHVLIHDAARPLVSASVISGVCEALAQGAKAAAPALPVTDALWRGAEGMVVETVPREGLYRAQTPQGFCLDLILSAHRRFEDTTAADDVALARQAGAEVRITPGCEGNIKLTYPEDFTRAESILAQERITP